MKKESLSDSIGNAKDEYIQQAAQPQRRTNRYKKALAAVAVIAVAAAAAWGAVKLLPKTAPPVTATTGTEAQPTEPEPTGLPEPTTVKKEAAYLTPQAAYLQFAEISAAYPDMTGIWWDEQEDAFGFRRSDINALPDDWYTKTMPLFLDTAGGKNAAFSPLSLLVSLAALTEISGGESRAQLMELLGVEDVETLRKAVKAIWLTAYQNSDASPLYDKEIKLIPATSFWLNKNVKLKGDPTIAETLKTSYFTSFFKGDPNDPAYAEAFKSWINDQTGGLLEDAVENMDFDGATLFQLVSTLLLKAEWFSPFPEEDSFSAPFHAAAGDETARYMTIKKKIMRFFEAEAFTAAGKDVRGGTVWFILPAQGRTPEDLLESGAYTALLDEYKNTPQVLRFTPKEAEYDLYQVDLTVPKFDFADTHDLKTGLRRLGVTELFEPDAAEIPFLTLANGGNAFLAGGTQDVRVAVNEQGVSAAAATVWEGGMGNPTFKDVSLTIDRPFMFLILSETEDAAIPLFAGIVNTVA